MLEKLDWSKIGGKERIQETILSVSRNFRSHIGLSEDDKLRQRFVSAGFRREDRADIYFTSRFFFFLAGLFC